MDTFEDLKLLPELVAGAESVGWDTPSSIQRDAVAKIRRGNNVVLHASPGSGHVGAYGLGILDRLARDDDEPGTPAVLVLTPDRASASATAASLARLPDSVGPLDAVTGRLPRRVRPFQPPHHRREEKPISGTRPSICP